jgi:uncharacterized membrane protein
MKTFWKIIRFLFGAFMVFAGVQHFLAPDMYDPYVPSFLPFAKAIIYASGLVEVLLGAMLFIPRYIRLGALGLMVLMVLFLPIHIWDVFSSNPAIGDHTSALIRLPVQFLFIGIAWKLWKLAS